ncbi:MAG: hypothetical protein FIA95_14495 [Gemmatimonadetes bacterium]|nr:hypothetical protein [Gemmatimonadota bacterium]
MNARVLLAGSVPPLILATGLAMASAADISVRRELDRSAAERALAGARAVSAFVAARDAEGIPWEPSLRRLTGFGQILEVQIRPAGGEEPRTVAAAGWARDVLSGGPPPAAAEHLARGEAWAGTLERVSGAPVARAFAPTDRTGSAYVAVVMSVAPLAAQAERLRPRFMVATALFMALGLVAALLSGRWLALGVQAVEAQARSVARGAPEAPALGHAARELADLAAAFQTMRSILEDSVAQGRRALLARPLTQAMRSGLLSGPEVTRLDLTLAGHRVTAPPVGRGAPGLFAGVAGDEQAGRAFIGFAAGSDAADRALEAAAARVFLEARLAHGRDAEEAIRETRERFALESLRLAAWTREDGVRRRIHTLPPEAERPLDVLESFFSDRDQQAAGAAMGGALHDLGPGLLVLVRPLDTPAPAPLEVP